MTEEEAIELPRGADAPDISILILSYGQVAYTRRCLASIARSGCERALEIVVSDDCSGDPELASLATIANVVLLRGTQNLGFLRHANWAARQCRGKYLLLMNNDTEFRPRAIDALYDLAESDPTIGLVGSKLIYPDGTLQEAGGIVWSDASAWNFGHGQDPSRPEFEYVRETDYISGASIMVRRSIWDKLGGFDERYAPAYYEDTDLAFRIRESGGKVVYCPRSVVMHHEGVSHGTDVSVGIKSHQVTNQATMLARWTSRLAKEHYGNGTNVLRARDRAFGKIVVLFIDHYVPEPDRDAGSRNVIDMMKSLRRSGAVVKFWPDNLSRTEPYTSQLQQEGIEVLYAPYVDSFDRWIAAHADDIDVVFMERPTVATYYMEPLKRLAPSIARIYYGVDLHFQRMLLQAHITQDGRLLEEADAMKCREMLIWRDADVVVYPSEEEVETVRQIDSSLEALSIVPFCFDLFPPLGAPPANHDILFVAGFAHAPNVDAAIWLVRQILPLVKAADARAKVFIAGSNPTPDVLALHGGDVTVTGSLSPDELDALYAKARVSVVPLRFGAGVKLKVVEALHKGLPLVTTPIGAQGLPGVESVAAVEDDEAAIAKALIGLLRDDDRWRAQAERQQIFARARFSRQSSMEAMDRIIEASVKKAKPRRDARAAG